MCQQSSLQSKWSKNKIDLALQEKMITEHSRKKDFKDFYL